MKKLSICFVGMLIFTGCSYFSERELLKNTDAFVDSLQTTYKSYGLLGASERSINTSDSMYAITPIGRLINVKIKKAVDINEYENLKEDLASHYKDDKRVNKVYICELGTIMIDCRSQE
jgi:retron-type reverse transcriptase